MLTKQYSKDKKNCKVTFALPAQVHAANVALEGDFTGWENAPVKMRHSSDGNFKASVSLEPGHRYRFRYRLDGERWENDWQADAYIPNAFGTEDSIVEV